MTKSHQSFSVVLCFALFFGIASCQYFSCGYYDTCYGQTTDLGSKTINVDLASYSTIGLSIYVGTYDDIISVEITSSSGSISSVAYVDGDFILPYGSGTYRQATTSLSSTSTARYMTVTMGNTNYYSTSVSLKITMSGLSGDLKTAAALATGVLIIIIVVPILICIIAACIICHCVRRSRRMRRDQAAKMTIVTLASPGMNGQLQQESSMSTYPQNYAQYPNQQNPQYPQGAINMQYNPNSPPPMNAYPNQYQYSQPQPQFQGPPPQYIVQNP